jgi:hypothetical protein
MSRLLAATGVTSQSVDVGVYDDAGLPVTGLVANTFPTVKYSRAGANADVTVTLSNLATITTAWADGGLKERGEGVYRLDLPNAVFSVAGVVTLRAEASGKHMTRVVIQSMTLWNTDPIIDANVKQVNDIDIEGSGTTGDPWGPVS